MNYRRRFFASYLPFRDGLRAWWRRWGVTRCATADREKAALGERLYLQRKLHDQALLDERKRIDVMVARLSELRWSRDADSYGPVYRLTLLFDPRLIASHFGHYDQRELELLGDYFGREVRAHIITGRFVAEASERRRTQPFDRPPS